MTLPPTSVPASTPCAPPLLEERAFDWPAMGGRLHVRIGVPRGDLARAAAEADRLHRRVDRWASRLTRFDEGSELSRLGRAAGRQVPVGPTLAAVLHWAERAEARAPGRLDVTLLEARLAAERGATTAASSASPGWVSAEAGSSPRRPWWLVRGRRGGVVHRGSAIRFDLDGVAKGWIADRALDLLSRWPAALVDADGDIAFRVAPGVGWSAAVAHPACLEQVLATLRLPGSPAGTAFGLATSGTSIHAWGHGDRRTHHLIDPATGAPAVTDVVQATVLATSARLAEVIAKAIVIAGSQEGLRLADAPDVLGVVLLLESDDVLMTEETLAWLA